jgi:hypothetical protein
MQTGAPAELALPDRVEPPAGSAAMATFTRLCVALHAPLCPFVFQWTLWHSTLQ